MKQYLFGAGYNTNDCQLPQQRPFCLFCLYLRPLMANFMGARGWMLFFFSFLHLSLWAQDASQDAFYSAFSSEDVGRLDAGLTAVKKSGHVHKRAYEGALMMKKAAFAKGNGKKLSMFKEGHKLLEAGIEKDPADVELRLIRLMIQENAPKVLKYNKDIAEDTELVRENYKKLSPQLQEVVQEYSKKSKVLKPGEFTARGK